jgi:hypothetical protein
MALDIAAESRCIGKREQAATGGDVECREAPRQYGYPCAGNRCHRRRFANIVHFGGMVAFAYRRRSRRIDRWRYLDQHFKVIADELDVDDPRLPNQLESGFEIFQPQSEISTDHNRCGPLNSDSTLPCRVGGGALAHRPPSAAQTVRAVFP